MIDALRWVMRWLFAATLGLEAKQEKARLLGRWFVGTLSSIGTFSATVSFEAKMEIWMRILTLFVGLIVSSLTAVSIYRSMRNKGRIGELREAEAASALCHACRNGDPPPACPIPRGSRPRDCQHMER